ncbi:hypothetical protein MRB53_028629 [Persea americana]|uniref:Uncharacterized protein n=1 Tax=Persea americana TaxID=3435 RepID=A0ACC2KG12_PERAE|nr:hypothetical protein MRB53_028629 [Persea americana]
MERAYLVQESGGGLLHESRGAATSGRWASSLIGLVRGSGGGGISGGDACKGASLHVSGGCCVCLEEGEGDGERRGTVVVLEMEDDGSQGMGST